jgi:hypothetical protein
MYVYTYSACAGSYQAVIVLADAIISATAAPLSTPAPPQQQQQQQLDGPASPQLASRARSPISPNSGRKVAKRSSPRLQTKDVQNTSGGHRYAQSCH